MTRVTLPFGIGSPVGTAGTSAPVQRIPAKQSFRKANWSNHEEEYKTQNDPRRDKRERLRQIHPGFVRINQSSRKEQAEQDERNSQRQIYRGEVRELAAVKPPDCEQSEDAANNESKLFFGSERTLFHQLKLIQPISLRKLHYCTVPYNIFGTLRCEPVRSIPDSPGTS
jgi:hypothetical protein